MFGEILNNFREKTTKELRDIYQQNDRDEWSEDAFKAIEMIMHERKQELTPQYISIDYNPLEDKSFKKKIFKHGDSCINNKEGNQFTFTKNSLKFRFSKLFSYLFYILGFVVFFLFIGSRVIMSVRFGLINDLIAFTLFGSFFTGARFFRKLDKQQKAIDAKGIMRTDTRAPILFLRSFSEDHSTVIDKSRWPIAIISSDPEFEEVLAKQFSTFGPFIAIGNPEDKLPPIGAARDYVEGKGWQERVEELLKDSELIIMLIGSTDSLLWEMNKIIELEAMHKLLLVFPPSLAEKSIRKDIWNVFIKNFESSTKIKLPPFGHIKNTIIIIFNEKGEIRKIDGDSFSKKEYEMAFNKLKHQKT